MSKGVTENVVFGIMIIMMTMILVGVSIGNVRATGEIIRSSTVGTFSERIESAIYGLSAFRQGKVQLDFQDTAKYSIYSNRGRKYLEYSHATGGEIAKIDSIPGVSYSVEMEKEDDPVSSICIIKDSSIRIEGGAC